MPQPQIKGRMISIQAALPKFPVAPLNQTLEKYLQTLRPLLTDEEYRNTEQLSDWWKNVSYLDYREPCVIHSNPGGLFPKADYSDLDGQLTYASRLIAGMLDYKMTIDNQTLQVEHLGKNPLCMMQYLQILSACRVPGIKRDDWNCFPPDKQGAPRHITVMYNTNVFEVPVYGQDGQPLTAPQLKQQFMEVVTSGATKGDSLGIFTVEHRDTWAKVYKKLLQDKTNKSSLDSIQKSILVLCLDGKNTDQVDLRTSSGHQMLHGRGSAAHTGNRWFDKTIQFIVGADGYSGLNYEHTTADGPPVIHLMDHCVEFIKSGKDRQPAEDVQKPIKLKFNLTPEVSEKLEPALIVDLDLKVLVFNEFGKDFPKSQRVSPDSFIQNAIQLAYYRHHTKPCGSYESASIRMFQLGRTETIRSCSSASLAFTQAMVDSSVSKQKKAELLRKAVDSHKQYTNDAISGKGVDRHLLGLKLTALENNMELPALFKDHAYTFSGTWRISTSQVPAKSESVLFFGPVVSDGYGFCYNPQENCILLGVLSFKSSNITLPAAEMANLVQASLCDMRDVLAATMTANL